ncbi:hypothetical protein GN330_08075 [Nitratireductor sp. CAU 1489]|uniref:Uncharacterized protein n=1 Tax=Nitratireductor arenosus TaxID=2682096 RepID=A0A844QGP9_9HYPH|nr:hypothetical protein [Nitratireductor arenosus]MVA97203.1 hypothetical protein [Nitratireductor arenosus]
MIRQVTVPRIAVATAVLLALLLAAGWLTREDPASKPYLKILGSGFMFNYRVADVYYGFTALVERPLPTGSIIEATFEDPAGGAGHVVRTRVGTDTARYSLRSPSVRGVEKDRPYRVAIRVLDREEREVLWRDRLSVRSQISDAVVPAKPLTVGPGYARLRSD